MPFSTYTVAEKFLNSTKVNSAPNITRPDGSGFVYDANFNIIAVLRAVNDADPADIRTAYRSGSDLTDAMIDDDARKWLATLNAREVQFAAVTVGVTKAPAPVDPNVTALQDATKAYTDVVVTLRTEQDKAAAALISDSLHDQYTAAYDAYVAAKEAAAVTTPVVLAKP